MPTRGCHLRSSRSLQTLPCLRPLISSASDVKRVLYRRAGLFRGGFKLCPHLHQDEAEAVFALAPGYPPNRNREPSQRSERAEHVCGANRNPGAFAYGLRDSGAPLDGKRFSITALISASLNPTAR